MSAFMVSTDHVNAILSWVDSVHRYSVPVPHPSGRDNSVTKASPEDFTEIGKALLSENMKSLAARYPSDWQEMVGLDVNAYRYEHDAGFLVSMGKNAAIAVIKLCNCLEYQSCEHDAWPDSYAFRFLNFVRDSAINHIPGYDAAPWAYDERSTSFRRIA